MIKKFTKSRVRRKNRKTSFSIFSPLTGFLGIFKSIRRAQKVSRIMFILLFSVFFLFVFVNRENFSPESIQAYVQDNVKSLGPGANFPYKVYEKKINSQNFKLINKNIAFVSDSEFVCLNPNAKEFSKRRHSFSNPVLKVSNHKVLLYDAYNKSFEIGSLSKSFFKKNLRSNILTGNIAPNGTYAFVTAPNASSGKLEIFKNDDEDSFFEYSFPDHYITDLTFNSSGKKCACLGFNSSAGEFLSSLFIFDYKSEEPALKIDFNKSMGLNLQFLDDKNIALIADNMLSIVDTNNGTQAEFSFKGKILTSYCIRDGKILLSLSLSDDGDNCEILVFNKRGALENTIKTNLKIKSLSFKANRIAALSYGTTYIYNNKGNIQASLDCSKDARKIEWASVKELYVLGLSEIRKLKV